MNKIPEKLQVLFPSTEIQNLDTKKDKNYIIQTLVKNSTLEGWNWMLKNYSSEDISSTIKKSRILTPKEIYFWCYYLNIPQKEVLCLNKDLQKMPRTSWAY
ncbi:MAG TPA: hypothetical protein ENN92_01355 [candidate division WWE3 bacterium]|uniref:DUF6922 domain-containing protein n=1 Tax=candidate division WWE3 bacterium TaxID=2053526 RepID=A0A7C1HMS9_UNCKA|nr:hypothetical protein [candidate division WWE3 bacterium]